MKRSVADDFGIGSMIFVEGVGWKDLGSSDVWCVAQRGLASKARHSGTALSLGAPFDPSFPSQLCEMSINGMPASRPHFYALILQGTQAILDEMEKRGIEMVWRRAPEPIAPDWAS